MTIEKASLHILTRHFLKLLKVSQEFQHFLHLIQQFFENFIQMSEDWHLLLPKLWKNLIMATKWAIIHIVTHLFQKIKTKDFQEFRQFLHLNQQFFKNLLHIYYVVMTIKKACSHILTRHFLKLLKKFFLKSTISSPNSTFLWKFHKDVRRLASVTTQFLKLRCHDYQMSFLTHFNSPFSKNY